ncbi:hypothetical protein SUDANB121_04182 [Nocardiopsis dassonvillei]|uniref:hypothetical protein n=1 Tax=Nocardiopsis dassonvillei TaxID=2014 RepID=UPI003F57371B
MGFGLLGLIVMLVAALVGIALVVGLVLLIVRAAGPKTPPAQPYPQAPGRYPGQDGPQHPQGPPPQGWGPGQGSAGHR